MTIGASNITVPLGVPGTGWRELDIMAKILQISPVDRPFFEMTGMATATNVKHEWQVRAQRARVINAMPEGANFTYNNVAAPTRVNNTAQIVENGVEVSATSQAENHYGAPDLTRDQIAYQSRQHGLDIEYSLIRGTGTTSGATTARQMNGLMSIITTNNTAMLGITLTESLYITNLLEKIWTGTGDKPNTVFANSKQINLINDFDAYGSTKWIDTTTREVVNQVLVYHSSYGTVTNYLCRDLSNGASNGEIAAFNTDQMKKAWLRTTKLKPVASTADGDYFVIISELTLEYGNELATAKMTNLATT